MDDNYLYQGFINEVKGALNQGGGSAASSSEFSNMATAVRIVAEFEGSGTELLFNAHNGSMILCSSEENPATFKDRNDATHYLIPISKYAYKVEVETTDPMVTMCQFVGVNLVDGVYTKVFASKRTDKYSYEFEAGSAEYMAINLIYEDTAAISVPWEYDATATTTITFSAAVATGGAPADWNAKEGEAGYVKNRTHWEEEGIVEILPETTVVFEDGIAQIDGFPIPTSGKTYIVNWNGAEYICVAIYGERTDAVIVGNAYAATEGQDGTAETGEPFAIVFDETMNTPVIVAFDGSTEATMSIAHKNTVIHHLDPKYIKDMYYEEEKTVTEPLNIEWDGDTTGRVSIAGSGFYKVSDLILSEDELKWAAVTLSNGVSGSAEEVWDRIVVDENVISSPELGVVVVKTANVDLGGVVAPEAGVYFRLQGGNHVASLSNPDVMVEVSKEIVHKIDRKYINGSTMFYCNSVSDTIYIDPDLTIPAMTADIDEAMSIGAIYIQNDISRGIHACCYFSMGESGYAVHAFDKQGNPRTLETGDFKGFPE